MTLPRVTDYDHGVSAIDAEYFRPGLAAIHLIVEGDKAALVDTGTSFSVPGVMETLRQKNLAPENVAYVFLTHVHLDHAGGAGEFMHRFPKAKLVVHPRGARHMADPAKLIAGTVAVYGQAGFKRMYGEIRPIDPSRIVEAPDGYSVDLNGRPFLFLDTPGHARHHNCIFDEHSQSFFAGDTFGVSYRDFDVNGIEFIFPTTTPVQFDPVAAHASLNRLMSYNPRYAFLTHYGRIGNLPRHVEAMHQLIDAHVAIAEKVRNANPGSSERHAMMEKDIADLLVQRIVAHGCKLPPEKIRGLLVMDAKLNAQGLESWLDSTDEH